MVSECIKTRQELTLWLDVLMDRAQINGDNLWCLHLFFFICTAVLSIYPLVMFFVIGQNIHVLFWMGLAPQYVNLLVPGCLLSVNLGHLIFQCARVRPQFIKVRVMTLHAVLGCILIVAGLHIARLVRLTSDELISECGNAGLTKVIQSEWNTMSNFYEDCIANSQQKPEFVQQCPGFAAAFGNSLYSEYMEDMEDDYLCQGFCKHWSKPLFNEDDVESTKTCARSIAKDIDQVSYLIAMPVAGYGVLVVSLGILLQGYDHI
mmetsp:Transcript_19546/g.42747  ORF Transcript_19546/g.42747 Transcript_19546/m.42747 type:complete len:262 (+) Transcript_19546:212-997(+)